MDKSTLSRTDGTLYKVTVERDGSPEQHVWYFLMEWEEMPNITKKIFDYFNEGKENEDNAVITSIMSIEVASFDVVITEYDA